MGQIGHCSHHGILGENIQRKGIIGINRENRISIGNSQGNNNA
jgi:hypothetical protein